MKKNYLKCDALCERLSQFGIPALVLLGAMSATGLSGAAAITAALALLGPGGMIGGLAFLGVISVGSSIITKYGYQTIMVNVAKKIQKKEHLSTEEMCNRIDGFMISKSLKARIKEIIREQY